MIFMTCYAYLIWSTRCRKTFASIHMIIRQIFCDICEETEVLSEIFKMRLSESPECSIILLQLLCNIKMNLHNFQMILSWLPISKSDLGNILRSSCFYFFDLGLFKTARPSVYLWRLPALNRVGIVVGR